MEDRSAVVNKLALVCIKVSSFKIVRVMEYVD